MKFAGYSLAAKLISNSYPETDRNPFAVGAVRMLIGLGAGTIYFLAWEMVSNGQSPGAFFLAGLAALRVAEWKFLLWIFYDRQSEEASKGWRIAAAGMLWSFFLDVPAIILFFWYAGPPFVC